MNFNNLPSEIQEIIFMKNREWTQNEIKKNKINFRKTIDQLQEYSEKIYYSFDDDWSPLDPEPERIEDPSELLYMIKRWKVGLSPLFSDSSDSDDE
tara:strand:- start:473 stop:760 length:288 start_codon:yes stop_codon:yes gene_type:complete